MLAFYKQSCKQLTSYGTVSLSYHRDNYSHEESSQNVHYLKAMPINFWKLMNFYHRCMNFNPYDGTKVKKGKTEQHHYNVQTVELASAKLYPNLECVGGYTQLGHKPKKGITCPVPEEPGYYHTTF
jgi:hypothetical protein